MTGKLKHLCEILFDKNTRFDFLDHRGVFDQMDDEKYLKLKYRRRMGKELNLDNPQTFNEKLQWLKLHDRNPLYTSLVDKASVKSIVAGIIGSQYIIPTIGEWDRFEDILWEELPDQFVLKCTHDSGGNVICKDKNSFNIENAQKILAGSLKRNFYYLGREWPYKDVKPRIIAEPYLEDSTGSLNDYKIYVFNGKAKALLIATDRQKTGADVKFDFFDHNGQHLPFRWGHENAIPTPKLPADFNRMKDMAELLGKEFSAVRIDFYDVDGNIYFGEITFFPSCGWTPFEPEEWDYTFGSWLKLPLHSTNEVSIL